MVVVVWMRLEHRILMLTALFIMDTHVWVREYCSSHLKFLYQALETFWGFSSFVLLNLCIMYCAMKMWAAENASGLYVCVCMCFAKLYVQKSSRHDEILKNHINSEPGYNFCHHNDDNCGFKASWNVNSIYIFFC